MSQVSRWSYTNVATVWPFVKKDTLNGGALYGAPYLIACCWTAEIMQMVDEGGKEYVSKTTFYHEDPRVKYLDRICKLDRSDTDWRTARAEEIRNHLDWDMSMLEDKNDPRYLPDFKSMT